MTLRKQLNVLPQTAEVRIVSDKAEKYAGVVSGARKACNEGILDSSAYVVKSIPVDCGILKIVIKPKKVTMQNIKEED